MKAARTSEMLVNFYQTTQHYNPEDSHLQIISQLIEKFPAFYETQKFITIFTRAWKNHVL
jgi:hypothetical protein